MFELKVAKGMEKTGSNVSFHNLLKSQIYGFISSENPKYTHTHTHTHTHILLS